MTRNLSRVGDTTLIAATMKYLIELVEVVMRPSENRPIY